MNLKKLRQKIDALDGKIIKLLNQRAKLSITIGKLKSRRGKGIYSPDREKEIFTRIAKVNSGPLSTSNLRDIYQEIISSSLSLERALNIAYLGPQATFTHLASLKKFGSQLNYLACSSITEIFAQVEKEVADYGVVPIENSIEGAVTYTLDMFIESELKICAEVILDISHNLLGLCPLNKIRRIYSNPQVFGQCRIWLQTHLPKAELREVYSTTKAAQLCLKDKYSSCIASILAARQYNLKVIAKAIEDNPYNITRFLVIGKSDTPVSGNDKTSIMFSTKDRIGALHDMLVPFKKYGINLTKIESRPSKKRPWEYYFFVDLEGHKNNKKVQRALDKLSGLCTYLKILGSYPRAE